MTARPRSEIEREPDRCNGDFDARITDLERASDAVNEATIAISVLWIRRGRLELELADCKDKNKENDNAG